MKIIIGLLLLLPVTAVAQQAEPNFSRDWSAIEIVLSVGILVFTLVLIGIEALLITKAKKAWAPASILKVIGLTLIVCIAALLVAAGYDQDQIAPVTGLLGVIAGYLLGEKATMSS